MRWIGASSFPHPPEDGFESGMTTSYGDIARILAGEGRPMSVEQVARLCRSAERKFAQALLADTELRALMSDTEPRPKANEPTRTHGTAAATLMSRALGRLSMVVAIASLRGCTDIRSGVRAVISADLIPNQGSARRRPLNSRWRKAALEFQQVADASRVATPGRLHSPLPRAAPPEGNSP
jgi:hypothetical protein